MSRCFGFLPLGYERNGTSRDVALIESIKLRREWENAKAERKKEKKRQKKEKKDKKNKDEKKPTTTVADGRNCSSYSREFKAFTGEKVVGEDEQLEKSVLTEEYASPVSSYDNCCKTNSSQTSNKRKRNSSDSSDDRVGGGKVLRIRLCSQKSQDSHSSHNRGLLSSSSRAFIAESKCEVVPDQCKVEAVGVQRSKQFCQSASKPNVSRGTISRPAADVSAKIQSRQPVARNGTFVAESKYEVVPDQCKVETVGVQRSKQFCHYASKPNVSRGSIARPAAEVSGKIQSRQPVARNGTSIAESKYEVLPDQGKVETVGVQRSKHVCHSASKPNVSRDTVAQPAAEVSVKIQSRQPVARNDTFIAESKYEVVPDQCKPETVGVKISKQFCHSASKPNVSRETVARPAAEVSVEIQSRQPVARIGAESQSKTLITSPEIISNVCKYVGIDVPSTSSAGFGDSLDGSRKISKKMRRQEMAFKNLFESWIPPPLQVEEKDCDDQGWLFNTKPHGLCESKRCWPINETPCLSGSSLCPVAHHIPEVDLHVLPYTVPF